MSQYKEIYKSIFIIVISILIIMSFSTQNLSKFNSSFLDLNYNQIDNSTKDKLKISNSPIWDFKTNDSPQITLAISSDGNYIVVGGDNINEIYLFNRSSSIPIWSYKLNGITMDLAISSDGKYFVIGSNDNKIYFFDRSNPSPLWTFTTNEVVMSVAISSDGNYIVAGGRDYRIYLFNRNSSTPIWSYTANADLYSVAISSDGKYIIAGGSFRMGGWESLYLFNKNSSTPIWNFSNKTINCVAISSDGNYIVVGGINIYLFTKNNSIPIWVYETNSYVCEVGISSDGNYIVAGSRDDNNIYLFNNNGTTPIWKYTTNDWVLNVAISSDGNYIVAGSKDYNVYLFSKNNSKPLKKYDTGNPVCSVDISSDGSYIVAGNWEGHLLYFYRALWKMPSRGFNLLLFLAILIPIVIIMFVIGGYLILRKRDVSVREIKRELKLKKYTEMARRSPFSHLKCIKCGTKEGGIFEYKSHGVIPTCYKCRKRFQIWFISKILLFFLSVAFIIVTIALFVFIPGLKHVSSVALPWIRTLTPYSITLLIGIIALIILRMKFGSKLKNYFRYNKDGYIKSEIDTEWISYRDWINTIFTERIIPDSEKMKFIENEIKRQNIIKVKNTKRAKSWVSIGYCNIVLGIISLIYGLIVSQGLGAYWYLPFLSRHLPSGGVFLLFGIIFLVYGRQKNIFFYLN